MSCIRCRPRRPWRCTSSSVFTRNQVTCLYGLHIAVGVRVRSSDSAGDVIGVYDTAC